MRGIIQRCASPVRMSRTVMALLTRVLPTASQVLTSDSKSTIVEAKYFECFGVADLQALWDLCRPLAVCLSSGCLQRILGRPLSHGVSRRRSAAQPVRLVHGLSLTRLWSNGSMRKRFYCNAWLVCNGISMMTACTVDILPREPDAARGELFTWAVALGIDGGG